MNREVVRGEEARVPRVAVEVRVDDIDYQLARLGVRIVFERVDGSAADDARGRFAEARGEGPQPAALRLAVVVGEGQKLSARVSRAEVARGGGARVLRLFVKASRRARRETVLSIHEAGGRSRRQQSRPRSVRAGSRVAIERAHTRRAARAARTSGRRRRTEEARRSCGERPQRAARAELAEQRERARRERAHACELEREHQPGRRDERR